MGELAEKNECAFEYLLRIYRRRETFRREWCLIPRGQFARGSLEKEVLSI